MNAPLFVTMESGLFTLREGSTGGVIRVKTEDAQGILDYARLMFGVGTVLNWRIGTENFTEAIELLDRMNKMNKMGSGILKNSVHSV